MKVTPVTKPFVRHKVSTMTTTGEPVTTSVNYGIVECKEHDWKLFGDEYDMYVCTKCGVIGVNEEQYKGKYFEFASKYAHNVRKRWNQFIPYDSQGVIDE